MTPMLIAATRNLNCSHVRINTSLQVRCKRQPFSSYLATNRAVESFRRTEAAIISKPGTTLSWVTTMSWHDSLPGRAGYLHASPSAEENKCKMQTLAKIGAYYTSWQVKKTKAINSGIEFPILHIEKLHDRPRFRRNNVLRKRARLANIKQPAAPSAICPPASGCVRHHMKHLSNDACQQSRMPTSSRRYRTEINTCPAAVPNYTSSTLLAIVSSQISHS